MKGESDKKTASSPSYYIITDKGQGEITEKKSRFIAEVFPVQSTAEAEQHIREVTKRTWDARHHCYAWVIGPHGENTRCTDDGEPSGTAGKPILDVLTRAGLTNTLIIVTRYFGGTLLGTGGLVRAYTQAAQAGLADTPKGEMVYGRRITIVIDYNHVQAVQQFLRSHHLEPTDVIYAENVQFLADIISSDIESVRAGITEITDGKARMEMSEERCFLRSLPV